MKTTSLLIPILLLSACGTIRETAAVQDDVYDIPDRKAMAAAASEQASQKKAADDDYYDPAEAPNAGSAYRDYYDMTYNDPYYYNYGRFGFGTGIGSYGPGFGMGLSYGWPTSFGSMSIGYGMDYGGGYGYNPYWGNSWMSGYGYGYNPYGYYGYGNYGYGYGGYGYGPYQGPWGGCMGCYEPYGYGGVVYGHRPSMATGSSGNSFTAAPRRMRNPASLMPSAAPSRNASLNTNGRSMNGRPALDNGRNTDSHPGRITAPRSTSKTQTQPTENRPSRNFNFDNGSSPSRSSGGNMGGGGGRISSPRPR